jgi:hypothetical protein
VSDTELGYYPQDAFRGRVPERMVPQGTSHIKTLEELLSLRGGVISARFGKSNPVPVYGRVVKGVYDKGRLTSVEICWEKWEGRTMTTYPHSRTLRRHFFRTTTAEELGVAQLS